MSSIENRSDCDPQPLSQNFEAHDSSIGMHISLPAHQRDCDACLIDAERQFVKLNTRLGQQAAIADSLRKTLLPRVLPRVDTLDIAIRYRAGDADALIGGDFYDVFEISPSRFAIVVGDVCAKGFAAAAEVAALRNMVRYALYSDPRITNTLTELNRILIEHRLLTNSATLFVAIFDSRSCQLRYASCGHEPAAVIRNTTPPRVEMLLPNGPVIGTKLDNPIGSALCELQPGDTLIVFTDGLLHGDPTRLGENSVANVLKATEDVGTHATATEIVARILGDVCWRSDVRNADDVCLLVAKVGADASVRNCCSESL